MHIFLPPLVFGRLGLRTLWGKRPWLLCAIWKLALTVLFWNGFIPWSWLVGLRKSKYVQYIPGNCIPSNEITPSLPSLATGSPLVVKTKQNKHSKKQDTYCCSSYL